MPYIGTSIQFHACLLALLAALNMGCRNNEPLHSIESQRPPEMLLGQFIDDYEIEYTISEKTWIMEPGTRFNIIRWNVEQQYLLAQNDPNNRSDGGKYSRIDYMRLNPEMSPFVWAFCLSTYDADNMSDAEQVAIADRDRPKQGCNGYPFSRMKPIQPSEMN